MVLAALLCLSSQPSQIAFVRHHALFVVDCDRSGKPHGTPVRICTMPREESGDDKMIEWTPTGKIALEPQEEPHLHPSTIDIVDARAGAKPKAMARGFAPSFSPDGKRMVYQESGKEWTSTKLLVFDLTTRKKAVFSERAAQPAWSPKGDRIACTVVGKGLSEEVHLREYPSGKTARRFEIGNPCCMSFSPDGALLAVESHLSRPLTGHDLYDVATGDTIELRCPDQYAPPTLEDWSPDSQAVVTDWRIVDPKNDGSWIKQYEAVTWVKGGRSQIVAQGRDAHFSADGQHLIYRTGLFGPVGDLYCQPIGKGKRLRIATAVSQFAVRR